MLSPGWACGQRKGYGSPAEISKPQPAQTIFEELAMASIKPFASGRLPGIYLSLELDEHVVGDLLVRGM